MQQSDSISAMLMKRKFNDSAVHYKILNAHSYLDSFEMPEFEPPQVELPKEQHILPVFVPPITPAIISQVKAESRPKKIPEIPKQQAPQKVAQNEALAKQVVNNTQVDRLTVLTSCGQDRAAYEEKRNKIRELRNNTHDIPGFKKIYNSLSEKYLSESIHEVIAIFSNCENSRNEFLNACYLLSSETLNRMENGIESERNAVASYTITIIKALSQKYPSLIQFVFEYLKANCLFLVPYIPNKSDEIFLRVQGAEDIFKANLRLLSLLIKTAFPHLLGEVWRILSILANRWCNFPLGIVACSMIITAFDEIGKPQRENMLVKCYGRQIIKLLRKALKENKGDKMDLISDKDWFTKSVKKIKSVIEEYK